MMIDVTPVAPVDWDVYCEGHAGASVYHRAPAVEIAARAFGLRTAFIVVREHDSRIRGVLPLVEQSSLLFGRFLVSVPFFTYGGILADNDDYAVALAERAAELAVERRARHVELRHSMPVDSLKLQQRLDKVSMVLPLPEHEDALARKLGSKLRSQIRRADREHPEVVWGGQELLGEFYSVFAQSMHALGTPVYPPRFFAEVLSALDDVATVVVVRIAGRVQAAAIVVRHSTRVEVPWAAVTPEAKRVSLNMRMYWEMLRFSIRMGANAFDFGRSTVDSGTYRFKAQWGASPMQLHWHYWLPGGRAIPMLNHANSKYAVAVKVWRRMPQWCANLIGPHISRSLP